MEHRRFTRVAFTVEGLAQGQSGLAQGTVSNLSLAGLLLRTETILPQGEPVRVQIQLSGAQNLAIEANGRVVRAQPGELAIELSLEGIDIDSLAHLRHVVAYNIGDDEQVVQELLEHIRRRIKDE